MTAMKCQRLDKIPLYGSLNNSAVLKHVSVTRQWPSWKNSAPFTTPDVVFLIDDVVVVVVAVNVIVILIVLDVIFVFVVFVVIVLSNSISIAIIFFLPLSKFGAHYTFGFTSSVIAHLFFPLRFQFFEIFALFSYYKAFLKKRKKNISFCVRSYQGEKGYLLKV